jgi:hypothetical protein
MAAVRVQRTRLKGWKTPTCSCGCGLPARYVGRGSKFGNPFVVGHKQYGLVHYGPQHLHRFGRAWDYEGRISAPGARHDMWFSAADVVRTDVRLGTAAELVELYRLTILNPTFGMKMAYPSTGGHFLKATLDDIRAELAGHDLMCWCPDWQPCHADVLLELANTDAARAA